MDGGANANVFVPANTTLMLWYASRWGAATAGPAENHNKERACACGVVVDLVDLVELESSTKKGCAKGRWEEVDEEEGTDDAASFHHCGTLVLPIAWLTNFKYVLDDAAAACCCCSIVFRML